MTMPRRLRDDPSAAPRLAERVRDASGPPSIPAAARKRVGDTLASKLAREQRWPLLSWPLQSWSLQSWSLQSWPSLSWPAAGLVALAVLAVLGRHGEPSALLGEDGGRALLRREPPAIGAKTAPGAARPGLAFAGVEDVEQVQQAPEPSATATRARAVTRPNRVPAARTHPHVRPPKREGGFETRPSVRPRGAARQRLQTPPWLTEARAALATDPERALWLIRAHRDPRAAVSPEVVELTILALEAQRSAQSERARSQP